MTIQISIAILLALFVLVGAKTRHRQTGQPAGVAIETGNRYTWAGANNNRDTLLLTEAEQNAGKVNATDNNRNETSENFFSEIGVDRLIEEDEILPVKGTSVKNYITRNIEQTILMSVK